MFSHENTSLAHADWSILACLRGKEDLPEHEETYDIACQQCVNIVTRLTPYLESTPERRKLLDVIKRLIMRLPAWHAETHVWYCRDKFSLKYTSGSGMTVGEIVEWLWRIANAAGPSTKEMNPGHRIDTLCLHVGDWNEERVELLGMPALSLCSFSDIFYNSKRSNEGAQESG